MKSITGTLVYVIVDRSVDCFDKKNGKEWKAGIVITDEDIADAWDELYPKQAAKKVKANQFEDTYKCELPEDAGKNVWVITLKKNEKLANGEPVPDKYRPRVFEKQGNSRVDITFTKLVGNGSKGTLSIDHFDTESYGAVARLKNVLVTDLIEYEAPEGSNYESGSEFDDEAPETKAPAKTADKPKPAAKAAAKKPPKEEKKEDEFDDSDPF